MKRFLVLFIAFCLIFVSISSSFAVETNQYQELTNGSKGKAVRNLQTRLKELGYFKSSVDGGFGDKTEGAVWSFQRRHNLTANGIATSEMQELLFSDEAKAVPKKQPLYITKVTIEKNGDFSYTVKNTLDEAVDDFAFRFITFDVYGYVATQQDLENESNLLKTTWCSAYKLSKGKSNTWSTTKEANNYDYGAVISKVAVGIESYHTVSGKTVYYNPNQITFYCSDGSVLYPLDESEPIWYKDDGTNNETEFPDEAYDISFGHTTYFEITWWLAEAYGLPIGLYVQEVQSGSIAEKAGILAGDIIVSLDGKGAYENNDVFMEAKMALLQGKNVSVEYYRNGETYTTMYEPLKEDEFSSKEDEITAESNRNTSTIDELIKLADLFEKGLITQEEFDELKKNLLN